MDLTLKFDIPKLSRPITYADKIMLIGSCFTEHISDRLSAHKFKILSNPHGILFNPVSVAHSLNSYVSRKIYKEEELFLLNELWNSWDHHTRFSDIDKTEAVEKINSSQREATDFLKNANWIIITLGSAFQYYLKENNRQVANNHRAPAAWFEKKMLSTDVIIQTLQQSFENIIALNPKVKFLLTISPVRHIREGVVDNNRSKARLIEAVHTLTEQYAQVHYFPAYEIVIDILRDYRFYDIDFVHPNYLATNFVWEKFTEACVDADAKKLLAQVQEIAIARAHRPRFPNTVAHKSFKESYKEKVFELMRQHPFLDFTDELNYFSS
ncbi:MAG TPA: GSCFA domain-containing protein [Flavipsychrobacter sp.]|nr:GSCFA domain-containing protein [Flavipsychrobacter sp.]